MVAFLSILDVAPWSAMDVAGIVVDVSFLSLADVAAVSDVNVAVSVVGVATLIVVDTCRPVRRVFRLPELRGWRHPEP